MFRFWWIGLQRLTTVVSETLVGLFTGAGQDDTQRQSEQARPDADPGFFAGGGGVNDGRVQRAPSAAAPTGGIGLINIKLST